MSNKAYKIIFALLTGSVFCILGVQVYWLYNSYQQKNHDFTRSVYDALEEVGTKLRDRKNLESLKMQYLFEKDDSLFTSGFSNKILVEAGDEMEMTTKRETKTQVKTPTPPGEAEAGSQEIRIGHNRVTVRVDKDHTQTIISSSSSGSGQNYMQYVVSSRRKDTPQLPELTKLKASLVSAKKQNQKLAKANREMQKLVDKVMTEIIVLDTETQNADTVKSLIKHSLENRGLSIPFDFSLQKVSKDQKPKVLVQSPGFDENKDFMKSDLSGSNVIPTREWLYLQFGNKKDYVMAGMQNSILLSLLFSLVMMSIFYYVMRLILKQKKLSEMKTDFINNMTHELKTPIATISLAVDAMNSHVIQEDGLRRSDYSRILKEETEKLNSHVERVLQVALLEKGELPLVKEKQDLVSLIKESLQNYQLQMKEKNATLLLELPETLAFQGDRRHLLAVFNNLLDNALKYSPSQPRLSICMTVSEGSLIIRYKDEGIGMNEEQQKRIFEKFYRAQGGNLHDAKGFGLGLSYTKSIVEAHGGRVYVKSTLNKGSEFILEWPYHSGAPTSKQQHD